MRISGRHLRSGQSARIEPCPELPRDDWPDIHDDIVLDNVIHIVEVDGGQSIARDQLGSIAAVELGLPLGFTALRDPEPRAQPTRISLITV